MLEINLCITSMGSVDKINTLLNSVNGSTLQPTSIYIIDNSATLDEAKLLKTRAKLSLFQPKAAYSVATSWNMFLHKYDDYIIISNDDIVLNKETIGGVVSSAEKNPQALVVTCYNSRWAFFLQRKVSLGIVGEYDSNFEPIYYEDVDYEHRMILKGYPPIYADVGVADHRDSPSLNGKWGLRPHVARNAKLYELKWGGGPWGGETFKEPFNL